MTFPAFFFGFFLAALFAAAFHFFRGDHLKKYLLYLLLAEIGFWVGHLLGAKLGWGFGMIGPLYTGMGALGAILILFIGSWLSRVEINRK
jgi:hypothetical protein